MNNPEVQPNAQVDLFGKLREVAEAIPFVEKRGRNEHHNYNFTQAVDVVRDVRSQLHAAKIILLPATVPGSVQQFTETGGKSFLTTIDLVYRFVCTETGAEVHVPWTAAGADTGGDKGIYKAYTGGLKYALISTFLLPMTDDPEHDALSRTAPVEASSAPAANADAERPAAPTIPLDRAKAVADKAVAAGLASWGAEGDPFTMEPVLKAKLADIGVGKLGELNVDTAEAVEAFISEEVANVMAEEPGA